MKLISLAIASIIDANFNQSAINHVQVKTGGSIKAQIGPGRKVRSKILFDLAGKAITKFAALQAKIRQRREEKEAIRQLLRLNTHLQNDIGITEFDLQGLRSGVISLDDFQARRSQRQTARNNQPLVAGQKPARFVEKGILELDSANQHDFNLAKCC